MTDEKRHDTPECAAETVPHSFEACSCICHEVRRMPTLSGFPKAEWTVDDVLELRPTWDRDRAAEFLIDNRRQIEDDMVERGWASIRTLLDMADDKEMAAAMDYDPSTQRDEDGPWGGGFAPNH